VCAQSVRWSPDGACLLSNSDDNTLRVYDVPPDALVRPEAVLAAVLVLTLVNHLLGSFSSRPQGCPAPAAVNEAGDSFWPALRLAPGESVLARAHMVRLCLRCDSNSCVAAQPARPSHQVYDCCWFPGARAAEPASCVFAATTRAHPVQLWDAVTGALRCTYRCGPPGG
jgi:hypothetical protein